ncbi:MAG: gluconate kinase [Cytophagales bacterium]|nr:MAG: gluconate kinase [Cytophagales bacterium]
MYIGVDIGTSSVKSVTIDNEGVIYDIQQIAYQIYSPESDFQEQNPEEIFEATMKVLQGSIHFLSDANKNISSVCFSAAMHSLMAVDLAGKPMTNLITWADSRAKKMADDLRNTEEGRNIYLQTGTAIHAMSPLCKLLWFKDQKANLLNDAHKFIGIKEYLFFKLFGVYVIDYSLASATGLFDVFGLAWHLKSLQLIGIEATKLSTPVPTTTIFRLAPDAAFLAGLPPETPFVIGASDGCLANLGAGAVNNGEIATTIGTSGAIRMTSDKPFTDPQMRTFCYITDENLYAIGGAINNGGIAVAWLSETFPPNIIAEKDIYQSIFELAATVPAGAEGLVFLPFLLGERAPIWNSDAKGVFFGIQKKHTQSHFYRSVLEGIMFSLLSVEKAFEQEQHTAIYATGGFTKTDFWVQMMADIFNRKIIVPNSSESASVGACLLAMKALGEIKNWQEVKKIIQIEKEFYPKQENTTLYLQNFALYQKLCAALSPLFA